VSPSNQLIGDRLGEARPEGQRTIVTVGNEETAMKRLAVLLVAVLIVFFGTAVPSTAWTHGIDWWGPGLLGLALGAALAQPYYAYPYYAPPYAYSSYGYPYPGPTVDEEGPLQSAPRVQRDVSYGAGCYHL